MATMLWRAACALAWYVLACVLAHVVAWALRQLAPGAGGAVAAQSLPYGDDRESREQFVGEAMVAACTHTLAAGEALTAAKRSVVLCKRSWAKAHALGAFRDALADADAALAADSRSHHAHSRRASALLALAVTEGGSTGAHLADAAAALLAAAALAVDDAAMRAEYEQRAELAQLRAEAHALRLTEQVLARDVPRMQRQLALAEHLRDCIAAAEAATCLAALATSSGAPAPTRLADVRSYVTKCEAQLQDAARNAPRLADGAHARTLKVACYHWLGVAQVMCHDASAVGLLREATALLQTPGVPAASAPLLVFAEDTLCEFGQLLCATNELLEAEAVIAKLDALEDASSWRRSPDFVCRIAGIRGAIALARDDVPASIAALRGALAVADEDTALVPERAARWAELRRTCLGNGCNLMDQQPAEGAGAAEAAAFRRSLFVDVLQKEPPDVCAICLADIAPLEPSPAEDALNVLGCWHVFHARCVHRWLQATPDGGCPTCRGVVLFAPSTPP